MKKRKKLTPEQRRALLPFILLIGAALIILGWFQNRHINQLTSVTGTVIGYRESSSENIMAADGRTSVYYAEYRYDLNGEEHTTVSESGTAVPPVVGTQETIRVSASGGEAVVMSGKTYILIGTVFVAFSLVMFVTEQYARKYLRSRKPDTAAEPKR